MTNDTNKRPENQIDGNDPHFVRGDIEAFHWFCSTFCEWRTGTDLVKVLAQIAKSTRQTQKTGKVVVDIWRVPLGDTASYEIRNYQPNVRGAIYIGPSELDQEKANA